MSAFDLGILDGIFITLGIESLIYMIVGHFRRSNDSFDNPGEQNE